MADASLQDRLRGHSKAFDGLLSLIPAKMYYGEEHEEEQWNKKKQSKAAAKAARKGRLDPDSEHNRNAKEVMDERAKNKRKRKQLEQEEVEEDDDDYEPVPGVEAEKPGEGLKKIKAKEETMGQATESKSKKQKRDDSDGVGSDEEEADEGENEEVESSTEANAGTTSQPAGKPKMTKSQLKMAAKKEKAKIKAAAKKTKKAEARLAGTASSGDVDQANAVSTSDQPKSAGRRQGTASGEPESDSEDAGGRQKQTKRERRQEESEESAEEAGAEAEEKGQEGRLKGQEVDGDDASARSNPESGTLSPIFDTTTAAATTDPASTSTSISSTVAPSEKPKHIKLPADMDAVRARLAAKIEALRAARKADGPDGKPIRTRQELIESRRAKQAQRKAHRQELRKEARLAEREKREHALASNSPSVMSPASGLELEGSGGFAFGRVAFGDGTRLSHDLTYVLSGGKRRGPSDPKTALLKVQNQKAWLQELDAEKREDIAEKEAWLTARRRAEGEKIRDDEAILKKAVKRKEVAKKKSEQAWKERSHGVASAQKERQRKREDNIRKRREDKMLGKAGKKKKASGGPKKARPGFEGSLGVGSRRK